MPKRIIEKTQMAQSNEQSIRITLRGRHNITYRGTLILSPNWTSNHLDHGVGGLDNGTSTSDGAKVDYDQAGASYYVIAVVLVYGMSIVMLIASHIKRRQEKVVEDKQINKYLQDFQIVKERHARDSYKNLKRTIMKKINWDRSKKPTYHTLQKSILPLLAISIPGVENLSDADAQSISSSLSNVDLAAAEQYMIAKDKGKVIHTKGYDVTAAYFAAARRMSKDIHSPQVLTRMCKERRLSRDHGTFVFPAATGHIERQHTGSMYYPTKSNRSRTSSCEEPVIEEPEPDTSESLKTIDSQATETEYHVILSPDDTRYLSPKHAERKRSNVKIKVDINPMNYSPARQLSSTSPNVSSSARELQVPGIWYSNPLASKGNTTPSPTDTNKSFPGYSRQSSQATTTSLLSTTPVSPRSSPRLAYTSRTTPPLNSDGSREELIQITCL